MNEHAPSTSRFGVLLFLLTVNGARERKLRCRLEEVNTAMKTVKMKVPDWYPGYAVVPYYAPTYPYYYPWYGYYVWPY